VASYYQVGLEQEQREKTERSSLKIQITNSSKSEPLLRAWAVLSGDLGGASQSRYHTVAAGPYKMPRVSCASWECNLLSFVRVGLNSQMATATVGLFEKNQYPSVFLGELPCLCGPVWGALWLSLGGPQGSFGSVRLAILVSFYCI
jgi:hypothetical protein